MLDWMVELLGLPDRFRNDGPGGGVIQDSASSAALCAVIAARERVTHGRTNKEGTAGQLVAYASGQTHSAAEKAVRIAGIGSDHLRLIDVDERFAMRPDALAAAIAADRAAGLVPCIVIATAGTTSSLAFDPIPEIADICQREGVWLHVDGAMAGIAALRPELRWVNAGLDRVDSYATNPHKWMGVNFDCTLFWLADRARAGAGPVDPPRVPAYSGQRVRRGGRLPRLADPPRPAVPRPQALVRAPGRRRRTGSGDDRPPPRAGRRRRPVGRGRRPLRAGRATIAQPRRPPSPGRRCRHRCAHRGRQRLRPRRCSPAPCSAAARRCASASAAEPRSASTSRRPGPCCRTWPADRRPRSRVVPPSLGSLLGSDHDDPARRT